MNDQLIIDPEIDNFVKELHKKYPESQLVLDKRRDSHGIMYLYLIGLSIRKQSRGEGVATKVIQEVFKYADEQHMEVHAWACNIFGTDLNTWIPFLEEMGFVKIDKDNNLIYFPK
jgi:GNAT superfamily N-acetyltransferase